MSRCMPAAIRTTVFLGGAERLVLGARYCLDDFHGYLLLKQLHRILGATNELCLLPKGRMATQ